MPHAVKYACRFFVLLAVVGTLTFALSPTGSTGSPYLSPLASIGGSEALAQIACPHQVCALHKNKCNDVDPSRLVQCIKFGHSCNTMPC